MTIVERPDGTPERYLPPISDAAIGFWDATRIPRLDLQRCDDCGRAIHFPRELCPHCRGTRLGYRPAAGTGTIHAVTVMVTPGAAFMADRAPYPVVLVDLDEGVRLMSNLVGPGALDGAVGDRVEVVWEPLADGRHLPLFQVIAPA
jgi:hypothetical protein